MAPSGSSAPHLEGRVAPHEARVSGVEGGDQGADDVGAVPRRHVEQDFNHCGVQHLPKGRGSQHDSDAISTGNSCVMYSRISTSVEYRQREVGDAASVAGHAFAERGSECGRGAQRSLQAQRSARTSKCGLLSTPMQAHT